MQRRATGQMGCCPASSATLTSHSRLARHGLTTQFAFRAATLVVCACLHIQGVQAAWQAVESYGFYMLFHVDIM